MIKIMMMIFLIIILRNSRSVRFFGHPTQSKGCPYFCQSSFIFPLLPINSFASTHSAQIKRGAWCWSWRLSTEDEWKVPGNLPIDGRWLSRYFKFLLLGKCSIWESIPNWSEYKNPLLFLHVTSNTHVATTQKTQTKIILKN